MADTSRTVVTSLVQITHNLDTEIQIRLYVDPAVGFPAGLHAEVTVPCTSGIPDRADFLMSLVPRTLSGITAAQAKDFLRDILVYAKGSAQLNYT